MKRVISLLLIFVSAVSLIACTAEEKKSNEVSFMQEGNKQTKERPVAKKDTDLDMFELENGLTFSIQEERQNDKWSYVITGHYDEKGYEMKQLTITIGSDSWYVAEPALYLEEDLKEKPLVIEREEPLASIDYSLSYGSKYGEEELVHSFQLN